MPDTIQCIESEQSSISALEKFTVQWWRSQEDQNLCFIIRAITGRLGNSRVMSLTKGTREKGVRERSTNSDLVQRDELKLARAHR